MKKTGGRPAFKPTADQRRKVAAAVKTGMKVGDIAGLLGITQPTLRKHFSTQLAKPEPEYRPTAADRQRVAIAIGGGMSQGDVALAMAISKRELRAHYPDELTSGALARRMDVLQSMFKSATKKGNTSSQRAYLAATMATPDQPPPAIKRRAAETPKRGKKEQANVDAMNAPAGSDWDDLIPPAGIVIQ